MTGPTTEFWQARFENKQTGWDRGAPSAQLLAWLGEGQLQPCRIAVPGCGNGWEVVELARRGFDVTGLDYTPAAVEGARVNCEQAGVQARIEQADVLSYTPAQPFDAVYEQTCLCALHPDNWLNYAQQLAHWIRPGGSLFALFMQMVRPAATQEGLIEGPPYHCDINAMRVLFPESTWIWPKPPYDQVPHPKLALGHELAVRLVRR
mgnify:CR=1 FL=1